MLPPTAVRPPAVAGMFYPGDVAALRHELARCLGAVLPAPTSASNPWGAFGHGVGSTASSASITRGNLKAMIVPHAGYIYSGTTAGSAFAQLAPQAGRIRRVVLLGPTHRVAVRGIAVPSTQAFATPLGTIPLDRAALADLAQLPGVVVSDAAHAQEHSLEVQLPFLQAVLGEFSLVPLAVGAASAADVAAVIAHLWGGDETLIVASSDLSHYHAYREAQRLDAVTAEAILNLQALDSFEQACGALPINGLLQVARERGLSIERLAQCNSGDTGGDRERVVGYAAFALYQPVSDTDALGSTLLHLARQAIAEHLGAAHIDNVLATSPALPALTQPGATFVTLTRDGELRGCIGTLEAWRPLVDDVRANAVAAATRDPRFAPLTAPELPLVHVEVSLLAAPTPLHFSSEVDALRQLRPGVDGVILHGSGRRATFLPQVWEQLPDPEQFMAHLKQKAGLPVAWWGHDAQLFRYEVQKWKA